VRVLIFSTSSFRNIFHSKNWARYDRKCISYKGFSQHNNKTTIMFTVLQRHVSTHTSHLQARTILGHKVTVLILGSQTLTCLLHRCYLFTIIGGCYKCHCYSIMYVGLCAKYLLFLSDFNETWIFSTDFLKNPEIWNVIKIRPVRADVSHADRRTDVTKVIVAFRNFTNAPKNISINVIHKIRI
jgi:hypothetical protein